MKYCIWGNRGLGDMIFMLPSINSIIKYDPQAIITISEGVWGEISHSYQDVLPPQVKLLKNPIAKQSEFVRNRISAKNQEQKDYWSQKIMEDALKDLSFDYFFSQRNFSFDKINAKLKLISKRNKNIHEIDVYGDLIQKAGITFIPDFSFSRFYLNKKTISKNIAFFPESGRQEKNISYSLTNDIQNRLRKFGFKVQIFGALRRSDSLNLNQIYFILNKLKDFDLALSVDTGLLHIADAMGIPCVGIYGPTDPNRYGPYHWRRYVIRSKTGSMCNLNLEEIITKVGELYDHCY